MTLRERLGAARLDGLVLSDDRTSIAYADLLRGSGQEPAAAKLAGRSVLVATGRQLTAGRAMVALDGLVRRLVLAPPGLPPDHVARIVADAEVELAVTDAGSPYAEALACLPCLDVEAACAVAGSSLDTEWVLATSGTTGAPKLVVHTLEGLAGAIDTAVATEPGTVWSTFYDIRRYGGLQVFLRAMLGPSSLVLSHAGEPVRAFLARAAEAGVTHLLGTPSHWRLALMSPELGRLAPRYVRLSGEIADQAVLDLLKAAFPKARLAQAYASTEGGVGFTVEDGREGFPATFLGARAGIEIELRDDTLHVRSRRTGRLYLGPDAEELIAPDGFVDTGDRVELRGERYHFLGRRSGVINVGGAKVQPEEVESVINAHPRVSMSRVRARPNPLLGAVVEAEIVLREEKAEPPEDPVLLKGAILAHCRPRLARHKVPASVKFVPGLPLTAGGKLRRAP